MADLQPTDVDAAVIRLLALLGIEVPACGTITMSFHEHHLVRVEPSRVIHVKREKAVAPDPRSVHTRTRT